MGFKLGDIIVDRLQFGCGVGSNGSLLYTLTQLKETTIDISADSTDITDKDGNLVYKKYSGKKGEVNGKNAFINLSIIETLSGTKGEIATTSNGIVMPVITSVNAGETLDITNYVTGTVVVNALGVKGGMGKEYTLATSTSSATEFSISTSTGTATLTPPTDPDEVLYIVKYYKTVHNGVKITNTSDSFPTSHELFFKALVVDQCDKESLRGAIVRIPSFMPAPEFSLALQGGDSQGIDFKGSIMVDYCSTNKELFSIYYIDEID